MKSKEIATIIFTAVVEAVFTVVLTQAFSSISVGLVLVFAVNAIVLYLCFVEKDKKHQETHNILKEMGINTKEDLITIKKTQEMHSILIEMNINTKEDLATIKKIQEMYSILKEMKIITKENLITHKKMYHNLNLLGVANCTDKLTDTPFTPIKCLDKIENTLFFMGVAGSKWVIYPPVFTKFKKMLSKVDYNNGEVRFLLLNPKGEGWKKLKELRGDNLSDNSYSIFKELVKNYSCLKVRLYDPLPSFRLQFIDGSFVAVSRYKFESSDYEKTNYGWDAPHLIVKNEKKHELVEGETEHFWSLYMAFQFLYDHIWNNSIDLSELEN